jgi:cell division protein FtsL
MIQPRERASRPPKQYPQRPGSARLRRAKTRRGRYVAVVQVLGALTVVVALVMSYLVLMANLTSMSYRIARAAQERSALQEQSMRLDDRVAHLESRERLAELAIKMGMQEPRVYAVVQPKDSKLSDDGRSAEGIALLGSIANWLKVR